MFNILGIQVGALEVFVWLAFALLAYIVARRKGAPNTTALGWFALGIFAGPLAPIGALFLAKP